VAILTGGVEGGVELSTSVMRYIYVFHDTSLMYISDEISSVLITLKPQRNWKVLTTLFESVRLLTIVYNSLLGTSMQ